jgi:hypothetical protein
MLASRAVLSRSTTLGFIGLGAMGEFRMGAVLDVSSGDWD